MGIKKTKHYKCLVSLKTNLSRLPFCVNIHIMYGYIIVKQKHHTTSCHLKLFTVTFREVIGCLSENYQLLTIYL